MAPLSRCAGRSASRLLAVLMGVLVPVVLAASFAATTAFGGGAARVRRPPPRWPLERGAAARLDPALSATLASLKDSVIRRDLAALHRLLDPEVRVTDTLVGVEAFDRRWSAAAVFTELEALLDLGGCLLVHGGVTRYVVPYVRARWPARIRMASHAAIVARDVRLRRRAGRSQLARAVLSLEIVKLVGSHEPLPAGWVKVRTPGRVYGYVEEGQVRRPTGPLLVLERRFGRWRIVELSTRATRRRPWEGHNPAPFVIPPPAAPRRAGHEQPGHQH